MSNNFDKFAILESFLDEVSSYLPEIEANLDRLQQEPSNSDVIEETYRRAHTIAGSAAMMEYSALAHVAQGMEDILGDALDSQTPIDQPTIGLLRRSFTRLSRLIEHIRSGEDDGPVVAEDDADRAAWRGGSASAASSGGAHAADFAAFDGSAQGVPNVALDGRDAVSSVPLHVPDWLAAFAAAPNATDEAAPPSPEPTANAMNASSDTPADFWTGPVEPTAPAGGYASPAFPMYQPPASTAFPQAPAPAANDWEQSPNGFAASAPSGGFAAPRTANGYDAYYGDAQSAPLFEASPTGPTGAPDETFDDILRSFQTSAAQAYASATNGAPGAEPENAGYIPGTTTPLAGASSSPSSYDLSAMGTSALPTMPPASHSNSFGQYNPGFPPSPTASGPSAAGALVSALSELRADEEAVRRQVGTLRDMTASLRDAAQAMEDERVEMRSFLDGSRDALERLEDWAGQQMGLDLRHSPDSVRRYLPLSVIWVTTTRLKQLVTLLKSSDRGLTSTQEQIEETLNELRSVIEGTGQIYSTMSSLAGPPDNGFSATVAQFTWTPPAPAPATPSAVDSFARSREDALSPAARAEIERDVRNQLRRELEDDVRAEVAADVRRDEEDRLRQEIQIQMRRQLLAELSPNLGASSLPMQTVGDVLPGMLLSSERAPRPVQVTSDQSPEALEVFREEAQEHLQTITTGVSQLETTPGDAGVLQSIRRAMHTLKGAAGMMGFTAIQHIAHASEDLLDRFVDEGASLTPNVMSLLLDTSEGLDQLVSGAISSPSEQHELVRSLAGRYAQIMGASDPDALLVAAEAESVADVVEAEEESAAVHPAGETTPDLSVRLQ
ncbi:MAG: Hpt domain-containing protein, partial [Ktedonobacterales bacterium]